MKKTQRSIHADKNKTGSVPPVSNGLEYAPTDNVQAPNVDARLTEGHKQSSIARHQAPNVEKPARGHNTPGGPMVDALSCGGEVKGE